MFGAYEVYATPTLVIIDLQGYICYTHVGLTEESVLRPEIESLLPKTIYVDDDNVAGPWNGTKEHPYQNITSGLEHASANDKIFVYAGTYYEHVVVNKTITLIGQDKSVTIIDGNKTGDVIQVKADNVTISGFTIRNGDMYGWHAGWGIYVRDSSGCRVFGNNVTDNKGGICIEYGGSIERANCIIEDNIVNNNFEGVSLYRSDNCTINRNSVMNGRNSGVYLFASSFCTITGNQIEKTQSYGIYLRYISNNNTIYHNNLIDNGIQASVSDSLSQPRNNSWDNGFEGNYWSNYTGVDLDHDGIGDTAQVIDGSNQDSYPLMGMFHSFNISLGYDVNIISNSTIKDFEYFESNSTIKMHVSNMTTNQTFGFCRVCISHTLMVANNISVIIDDGLTPVLYHNYTLYDNGTHRWIYFAYEHSTHEIVIIPEFPPLIILPLFMTATLLAGMVCRRNSMKKS